MGNDTNGGASDEDIFFCLFESLLRELKEMVRLCDKTQDSIDRARRKIRRLWESRKVMARHLQGIDFDQLEEMHDVSVALKETVRERDTLLKDQAGLGICCQLRSDEMGAGSLRIKGHHISLTQREYEFVSALAEPDNQGTDGWVQIEDIKHLMSTNEANIATLKSRLLYRLRSIEPVLAYIIVAKPGTVAKPGAIKFLCITTKKHDGEPKEGSSA